MPSPETLNLKPSVSKDKMVIQLQAELVALKEDIRTMMEEQEAGNEELQSANEEIVSSNEELQSINEELETSKEELESTNEELMTINDELQVRNLQLSESTDYAEAVFETIREAVLLLDKDLRILSANKAFYKTFKIREDETEGAMFYELGNQQWHIPELMMELNKVIPLDFHLVHYEVTNTFQLIGEKTMLINAKKIQKPLQNQEQILLTIEDITEHRAAQKLLEEKEKWFRNMADNAPAMIWVADTSRKRTFFNKTWLDFTGRTLEQEINEGWIENIHKDDIERLLKTFNENFTNRTQYTLEFRLRKFDKTYHWMLATGKPTYNALNEFTGYIGTLANINDQKVAEQLLQEASDKLHTVLDALPNIAWIINREGKAEYFNQQYFRYTGLKENKNFDETLMANLFHKKDIKNYFPINSNRLEENFIEGEARLKRHDGEFRWHLIRGVPVKDDNGRVKLWVGTGTDIHTQKTLNEELEMRVVQRTADLQQINKEMERSNSELQQFAYVASHDLQEPLRKIVTFADRLLNSKSDLPEKSQFYIDKIVASSQRMTALIEDLLNFSRISRTGNKFTLVDLKESLLKVLSNFDLIVAQKNATITYQNLPVIEAIPVQMEQLFHNLISNALKFSQDETHTCN